MATAFIPSGGTWNTEGVILLARSPNGPIEGIAESGGEPVAVTHLAPQHSGHGYPQFLPDGRHFLYYAQVRWRADGRELFYLALDGRLMAVSVDIAADGRDVEVGAPVPLFTTRVGNPVPAIDGQQYIVTPDGQRFLMNTLTDEAASGSIVLILNMQGPAR